ncbi:MULTISPECIES: hypothetical protein [unclassified Streptomyces]|uniref:hypothetical protein n=1 Tax=unclassified Streptomyces TaxID=2593676 RepID=UPI000376DEBB|nr:MULTISPECIES: hypothetical protein [unclassified Streptomyces]MYT32583.1 hypothetical protein [Streptomyces sp. SID8354]
MVAGRIGWLHSLVHGEIGRRIVAGEKPEAIATAILELLDVDEEMLSTTALTDATRPPGAAPAAASAQV